MSESCPTNRLAKETSPYLLQHQHNPVDWFPWGEEAFREARERDKLVLLSVGYSACHWCHVMERESFEDEAIAALMNELYVNVKVDREERPDVDHIYMQVVQAMTGQGGWPMTVFMTPDGVPIFGGTYFPPDDRRGMPGLPRVLKAVQETWQRRQSDVEGTGRDLLERLQRSETPGAVSEALSESVLSEAFGGLSQTFDERYGGMDQAPKFPQPMTWELVLRWWARSGDERAETMVRTTLTGMARGGMYDQLGGGFHRYSVDGQWLVPHFEKMLYDNAQLARLYTDGWLAFGDDLYRRVAEQTLDYLVRQMRDPAGGFYSSEDADSEGEEGRFFVWTPDQVEAVLGDGDALRAARAYWCLDGRSNFEGAWILHVPREPSAVAARLNLEQTELSEHIESARAKLFTARTARVRPGRDDKVLAAWNGMACRAFAEAGRAFGRDDYTAIAAANADFLLAEMRRDDGRLLRSWKAGEARLLAYLEDYGHVVDGLMAVYQATFERRYLDAAIELAEAMVALFWDETAGGFYDTGADHELLVVRPRDMFDNASPCGSSVAADVLLRLAVFTGRERWAELAAETLRGAAPLMARYPGGAGRFASALDFHQGPVVEIALVWPDGSGPSAFLGTLFGSYRPNRVVVGAPESAGAGGLPLLEARPSVDGRATAYVCEHYACKQPTTDAEELAAQLSPE